MILGPDGKPATTPERKAIGFTERTLPAESGGEATAPTVIGGHYPIWRQRGGGDGSGWDRDPHLGGKP